MIFSKISDVDMCAAQSLKVFNKLSKLFQPINVIPKDAKIKNKGIMSNSQKVYKRYSNLIFNIRFFCS